MVRSGADEEELKLIKDATIQKIFAENNFKFVPLRSATPEEFYAAIGEAKQGLLLPPITISCLCLTVVRKKAS